MISGLVHETCIHSHGHYGNQRLIRQAPLTLRDIAIRLNRIIAAVRTAPRRSIGNTEPLTASRLERGEIICPQYKHASYRQKKRPGRCHDNDAPIRSADYRRVIT